MTNNSKLVIVAVVCIVASALISGILTYNRFHFDKSKIVNVSYPLQNSNTPTDIPTIKTSISPTKSISIARPPENPTSAPVETDDLDQAMKVLIDFNQSLFDKDYDKAASLFDWDSITDPQFIFGKDYVAGNNSKTFENVCKDPDFCLQFYKILKTKKEKDGNYTFTIQYKTKDEQIYVNSVQVSGSFVNNTDFLYSVVKKNGGFKVASPPNWFNTMAE